MKQKRQNLDNFIRATIHLSWKPISSSGVRLLSPISPCPLVCVPPAFSPTFTSSLQTVPNGQGQRGLLVDNYRLWVQCPIFAPSRTHGFGQGVVQSTRFQGKPAMPGLPTWIPRNTWIIFITTLQKKIANVFVLLWCLSPPHHFAFPSFLSQILINSRKTGYLSVRAILQ